ncbi:3-deoxy-manno-octulosonate cytidylyltransferase [Candidatus Bilamarchaeum dharawalense]|uniref:3-deoxy-manno-octulosonate cytidylyltransferase n=1 Tax=Candidatus Bilamarchaeum dharawalense TaxID=2885759 RepID=A0A5E4LQX9_9ARCH|nr:3-deoxy-manno-octulosonate cytidylyltransferase [Candidatus Bilamarchaeum dharawalense]
MSTYVITQARMTSTRLPGKILKQIFGKPLLVLFLERLKRMKTIDGIIVATTADQEDDVIVETVSEFYPNMPVFRGDREDVLDRYYQCAKKFSVSTIVRITSDCPLIDPHISDLVVSKFLSSNCDYCSNNLPYRTYPHGLDTEVFSLKTLEKAWNNARTQFDREHVTPYIYHNPNLFELISITSSCDLSSNRWTVDYPEDFEFVKAIYEKLYQQKPEFDTNDILELIKNEPQLIKLNSNRKI